MQDKTPNGGGWPISRAKTDEGYRVTMTSGEGRASTFEVDNPATGDVRRIKTGPDGHGTQSIKKTNGERTTTAADGTVTTEREDPDPRFGMLAPVPEQLTVTTPSGLQSTTATSRSAVLSNQSDPLSQTQLSETVTVNSHRQRRP